MVGFFVVPQNRAETLNDLIKITSKAKMAGKTKNGRVPKNPARWSALQVNTAFPARSCEEGAKPGN